MAFRLKLFSNILLIRNMPKTMIKMWNFDKIKICKMFSKQIIIKNYHL